MTDARDAWAAYIDANDVRLSDGLDAATLAEAFPTAEFEAIDRRVRAALSEVPASRAYFERADFDAADTDRVPDELVRGGSPQTVRDARQRLKAGGDSE